MDTNYSPTVTVIIPVYNGVNYLVKAIDSVFAQRFTDYELIVVDDGSTDDTWQVIQSYGDQLRGFHKKNGGVASALNLGIQNARGKWIAWLSHDDVFLPDKLVEQVVFLNHNPQFKACYTAYIIIDSQDNFVKEYHPPWYPSNQVIRQLFGVSYINGSTMLIERSCFDSIGMFDESLPMTQDAEMWFRIAQHFEIGRVDELLIGSRKHPTQTSQTFIKHTTEIQVLFINMFQQLGIPGIFPEFAKPEVDPREIAWGYQWLGDTLRIHRGWYTLARELYHQSLSIWPSWQNPARFKLALMKITLFGPWKNRETAEAFIQEGRCLAGQGQTKQAGKMFAKALANHPTRFEAFVYWLMMGLGKDIFLFVKQVRRKLL